MKNLRGKSAKAFVQSARRAPSKPRAARSPEREAAKTAALLRGFKNSARLTQQRMDDEGDSEFWFSVSFATRSHKEAFLRAIGLDPDSKYLIWHEFVDAIGITVANADPPPLRLSRVHKTLTSVLKPIVNKVDTQKP